MRGMLLGRAGDLGFSLLREKVPRDEVGPLHHGRPSGTMRWPMRARGYVLVVLREKGRGHLRGVLLFAIATLLSTPPGRSGEPPIAVISFDDTSCGAWTRSAVNESARAQYLYWFRGFVSGYNFGRPDNQVGLGRMPDLDTLALYIDKYCREKPLNPFNSAAFDLVRELRNHPEGDGRK
jgi:hypothetical protein